MKNKALRYDHALWTPTITQIVWTELHNHIYDYFLCDDIYTEVDKFSDILLKFVTCY